MPPDSQDASKVRDWRKEDIFAYFKGSENSNQTPALRLIQTEGLGSSFLMVDDIGREREREMGRERDHLKLRAQYLTMGSKTGKLT